MKKQSELNMVNKALKAMSAELVKMLEGETGAAIAMAALEATNGSTYGNTAFAYINRVNNDALAELIEALKIISTTMKPVTQKISDEMLNKIQAKCRATQPQRRGSLFEYELLLGEDHIAYFHAANKAEALEFANSICLMVSMPFGFKRITKAEKRGRAVSYACSPESEAYWST